MKRISLTQGQFAIVDSFHYQWLSRYGWHSHWNENTQSFYSMRMSKLKEGKQYPIYMHREILGLVRGDKRQADHINHDTLDNCESNLRIVTHQQNHFNRKNPKGYYKSRRGKKYRAQIRVNSKLICLGYFDIAKEAHNAYLKAKIEYHKFGGIVKK